MVQSYDIFRKATQQKSKIISKTQQKK